MEEDFYATIKLTTGEEIFGRVLVANENNSTLLMISNPVVITEIKTKRATGYKFEPWLKTTNEDLYIINMNSVVTIIENDDAEIHKMHDFFANQLNITKQITNINNSSKVSRKMGYISSIDDAKKLLEKIYNDC